MNKFEFGDLVCVVSNGHTYSEYIDMFKHLGMRYEPTPSGGGECDFLGNGTVAWIIGGAAHLTHEGKYLYAIRTYDGRESLIGSEGVAPARVLEYTIDTNTAKYDSLNETLFIVLDLPFGAVLTYDVIRVTNLDTGNTVTFVPEHNVQYKWRCTEMRDIRLITENIQHEQLSSELIDY